MIFSRLDLFCPNCSITIRVPFSPYDFEGNFVHQEADIECSGCGYPIKFTTKEIEERFPETREDAGG